jgi:hypothetical protein
LVARLSRLASTPKRLACLASIERSVFKISLPLKNS